MKNLLILGVATLFATPAFADKCLVSIGSNSAIHYDGEWAAEYVKTLDSETALFCVKGVHAVSLLADFKEVEEAK